VLIERNEEKLVVRVGAIETTIPQEDVRKVEIQPTVREEYQRLRAAISDADSAALVRLARWLQSEGLIREALYEMEQLLERDPTNGAAAALARQIEAQIALEQKRVEPGDRTEPRIRKPEPDDFPLLTPKQINVLKVYEIDMADPPRIEIERGVVEELMRRYADSPDIPATQEGRQAMLRQSPERILELMFSLRARDMYADVEVLGHPESMQRFKTDVHRTWIVPRCATTDCHGGEEAGLRLYSRRGRTNTDEAVYTNFLILDRYRTADGQRLINVEDPERSLLLQIALPRDNSLYPHPEIPETEDASERFSPAFRSTRDRRFEQAVEWIESLYQPRVEYPIQYPPPETEEQTGGEDPASESDPPSSGP
jgi:hypothetical protein